VYTVELCWYHDCCRELTKRVLSLETLTPSSSSSVTAILAGDLSNATSPLSTRLQ